MPHFRRRLTSNRTDVLPIFAIDPGGTTGWSFLVLPRTLKDRDIFSWNLDTILSNRLVWEHGEIVTKGVEDEGIYALWKIIDTWPTAAVVVEDFILRTQRKEKSRDMLSPVRLNAKLETYLWRSRRPMFLQQPSQAKTTVTDDRLHMLNCYNEVGGLGHARDADRHAILFVRRCLGAPGVPVKHRAWNHIYGGST